MLNLQKSKAIIVAPIQGSIMKKAILLLLFLQTLLSAQSTQIETIEKIGDYMQIAIPLTAWATTIAIDDTDGQIDFYKSFGATLVTTQVLKYTINEKRPYGGPYSFPSGHTSASFQGAAFIHFRYGLKYAVVAYTAATFVGYSRVVSNNHYTHDVVAGAALGIAFAWLFTKPYKVKAMSIEPTVTYSNTNKTNLYTLHLTF